MKIIMITFFSVLTTETHMKHIHAVVVQIYTYISFSQFARKAKSWLFMIELYHFTSLLKILLFKHEVYDTLKTNTFTL